MNWTLHDSQRWSIFLKTKMFVVPLPLNLALCLSQNKDSPCDQSPDGKLYKSIYWQWDKFFTLPGHIRE